MKEFFGSTNRFSMLQGCRSFMYGYKQNWFPRVTECFSQAHNQIKYYSKALNTNETRAMYATTLS